jgi:hypothetical protein
MASTENLNMPSFETVETILVPKKTSALSASFRKIAIFASVAFLRALGS